MEHAGLAVAQATFAVKRFGAAASPAKAPTPSISTTPIILVCCGPGYNGGDGLAAARHLCGWGFSIRVVLAGRVSQLREEPAVYAAILQRLGIPMTEYLNLDQIEQVDQWLSEDAVIIDALLGIGVKGAVREPIATLIDRMNRSGKPIISADIPSGLDGDTGLPQGVAVKATVTVALGLAKQGCVVGQGPTHVGELVVDPISIPRVLLEAPH